MFDSLIDSGARRRRRWGTGPFSVALLVHLALVAAVVLTSHLQDSAASEPPVKVTFLQFGAGPAISGEATAPGPPRESDDPVTTPAAAPPLTRQSPDPLAMDAFLKEAENLVSEDLAELLPEPEHSPDPLAGRIVQPLHTPKSIHTGSMPGYPLASAGPAVEGGLPGGVPGGIPGGIPGGVVGGDPLPPGPLRAGGGVTAPVPVHRVQPTYPTPARNAHLEGQVTLEAVILRDGGVGEIRVVRGLGMGCTQAAIEALKQWRFNPGRRNGRPVDVYFELTVDFVLG